MTKHPTNPSCAIRAIYKVRQFDMHIREFHDLMYYMGLPEAKRTRVWG